MRLGAPGQNKSLSSRANYLQVLLENTSDIVTVVQPTGAVLYTSPALSRVLDYELAECPGKNIFDFVHPDDLAAAKKALDETIRNPGNVGRVEFRCRHHDGSWRELEALSKNLLDNPDVAAIVVDARDITMRKEAERALLQSQAALRETHKQLAAVRTHLLTVEEGELKRIAREIHDDLNQQLAMISVHVDQLTSHLPADREETCRRLREIEAQLARLSDDLHRMAHQLHPSTLEDLGLIRALKSHCRDLSRHGEISISFDCQGTWKRLPSEMTLTIYRVAQEALRNVIKHSNAKKADVSLSRSQAGVRLRVRDFGKGFKKETKKRGLGLLSMQERARLVGGTLSFSSEPGDGTIIEAEFPV